MCDQRGTMVGHLPPEVSRITKFIIDRSAAVSVVLTGTYYRRSPLVKVGWRSHANYQFPCAGPA